ncbi:hypothetical protein SEA_KLEVEY_21 [Arthrobacter phage Klevey]|uniref:Uncharacterized protein n=1 Tax=Arthrobacter phage Klevey TaxID=2867481 RepID=A0AAE8XLE2_9CAUD|nr:hypothetical protein SEA_KLEVEY_21 [Arthrobacter phage Klevey]
MIGIWSGMLVPGVVAAVDSLVPTGAEADAYVKDHGGARLELAEVLSTSAARSGISLPDTDAALVGVLRKYGKPARDLDWAIIGVLPDGRTAIGGGGGTAIESVGDVLAVVESPGEGRYAELWAVPGFIYLGIKP